jgi:hypothetical protein
MRYVGGQETALIASNVQIKVQIKTQQLSDLQKTDGVDCKQRTDQGTDQDTAAVRLAEDRRR